MNGVEKGNEWNMTRDEKRAWLQWEWNMTMYRGNEHSLINNDRGQKWGETYGINGCGGSPLCCVCIRECVCLMKDGTGLLQDYRQHVSYF